MAKHTNHRRTKTSTSGDFPNENHTQNMYTNDLMELRRMNRQLSKDNKQLKRASRYLEAKIQEIYLVKNSEIAEQGARYETEVAQLKAEIKAASKGWVVETCRISMRREIRMKNGQQSQNRDDAE